MVWTAGTSNHSKPYRVTFVHSLGGQSYYIFQNETEELHTCNVLLLTCLELLLQLQGLLYVSVAVDCHQTPRFYIMFAISKLINITWILTCTTCNK